MKKQTLSDNRQFIDGEQAKQVNANLRQVELLKAQIKELKDKQDNLVNAIKQLGVGKYETLEMSFDITSKNGSVSVDKDILAKLYPEVLKDERIYKYGQPSIALINIKTKV